MYASTGLEEDRFQPPEYFARRGGDSDYCRGRPRLTEERAGAAQRQRDDADRLRHLEADAVNDVEAGRADRDAKDQEENKSRHPRATSYKRRRDCEREQSTRDQN